MCYSKNLKLKAMDPELYSAAINGSESLFEKIRGVDLNLQLTSQGNSLLHVAAKSGKKQIVELILNSQPSLMYKTNSEGNTPLHIAASLGHLEMTQLLIDHTKPQGVEMQNELQEVEVHIELQEVEGQNELLIRMVNLDKDTPMHVAVRNGHYEIVDILIREDPGLVSSTNSAGESPLFLAVDRGFYDIALHILKIVPECSYEGRNKMNVLHAATIRMNDYFVRELLNNCPPSALLEKDDFGWIPLHHAAHMGNAKVVAELFLEINHHLACITDNKGMSALHISANEGHVDMMRTLITKCPEICELLDSRGRTALHVAVENGKSDAVKMLLETVAFQDLINKQDKEGNTPLHLAAVKGSFALLEILAQNSKVDKGATNKKGMTVIDIVPSNMELKQEDIDTGKEDTSNKLKRMGFLPSLQQRVNREATEANRHEQSQQTKTRDEALKDMAKTTHQENAKVEGYERLKEMTNIYLLIDTIIATVSFTAGITLPGTNNTSINGLQTLTPKSKNSLQDFVVYNSLAFGCSSASMFIPILLPLFSLPFVPIQKSTALTFPMVGAIYNIFGLILSECALVSMIIAFMAGTRIVFPQDSEFGDGLFRNAIFTSLFPVLVVVGSFSVLNCRAPVMSVVKILKEAFKK